MGPKGRGACARKGIFQKIENRIFKDEFNQEFKGRGEQPVLLRGKRLDV